MNPTNPKHPFWKATTDSCLKLTSINNTITITVRSTNEPYVYKICSDNSPRILYLNKKNTIKYISEHINEYSDNVNHSDITKVEFIEVKKEEPLYLDSCPSSPTPENIRRSSIKTILGSPRFKIPEPETPQNSFNSEQSPSNSNSVNNSRNNSRNSSVNNSTNNSPNLIRD